MANSIRTPKHGHTPTSRRIAAAVDNEEWQRFRLSMKGMMTAQKLSMLHSYYNEHDGANVEYVRIRIDNYIKALCRGGQLYPGESLVTVLARNWQPIIKKQ